jgi:serine/threonine protein kinase/tetratricopeptide (TPR) repeat protein
MTEEKIPTLGGALAGRYNIEREIGRGASATVWLAEDVRHSRQVAIKLLKPELAAMLGPDRFLREIEIVAGLSHPHILPLFDSGDANGVPFYVMPYVAGESLRGLMDRQPQLPIADAVRYGREIAGALDFAHEQGVIHRDVKPENILLVGGHAVITDFGIARAIDVASHERLTMLGLAVGTPAYISPEQAAGDPNVDARSDIYSLGCMLYEMLVGHPPFVGRTKNEIIAKRFVERPALVSTLREGIPPSVAAAVERALERDADKRFRIANEFALALEGDAATISDGRLSVYGRSSGPTEYAVAVLPFTNMSGDQEAEYFADGMTDELINALSHVPSLRVPARTSSFAYKRSTEDVRSVGQKLGVASVLEGTIRRSGNRLRVTTQLIDVKNGFHLWSERYDREMKDVFEIQDEISAAIAQTVKGKLITTVDEEPAVKPGTDNLDAYHLYLRGRYHWYQRDLDKAIKLFEQAVAFDPNYALAYCGLADTYSGLALMALIPTEAAFQKANAMIERALAADDTSAEVQYSRGLAKFFFEKKFEEAIGHFRQAIEVNPRLAAAHSYMATVAGMIGDEVTALAAGPRAQELEPMSPLISTTASMGYFMLGKLELTEVACRQAITIDPGQVTAQYLLGLSRAGQGFFETGLKILEETAVRMQRIPHILMLLGEVLWWSGRKDDAKQILRELFEKAAKGDNRPVAKAWLLLHMGDLDQGFRELDLAVDQHDPAVGFLLGWPGMGHVRADARYEKVLERLSLTKFAGVWGQRSAWR